MKNRILISINPYHVKNILNETKKFEYRRTIAKSKIDLILIYSTFPEMKIVAEVKVNKIISLEPNKLWEKTNEYSGISKEFFDQYFIGKKIAHAYELGKIKKFKNPKSLSDYGIKYPPQSFIYL